MSTCADLGDAYADCDANAHTRRADIRVASDCPSRLLEEKVVHELLHCHTAALPAHSAEAQRVAEEQLIDTVAYLLAKWRPAAKPRTPKGTE